MSTDYQSTPSKQERIRLICANLEHGPRKTYTHYPFVRKLRQTQKSRVSSSLDVAPHHTHTHSNQQRPSCSNFVGVQAWTFSQPKVIDIASAQNVYTLPHHPHHDWASILNVEVCVSSLVLGKSVVDAQPTTSCAPQVYLIDRSMWCDDAARCVCHCSAQDINAIRTNFEMGNICAGARQM